MVFELLDALFRAVAVVAGRAVAGFDVLEFADGLGDVVLRGVAIGDFHLGGCDPEVGRRCVVAQDQKFPLGVCVVALREIAFGDGVLDVRFFVFMGDEVEQGAQFRDGLLVVAFVGQVNRADVDAGLEGEGVLRVFADELAREVDGEVVGVEVAVTLCDFVEDFGFFSLRDAFFKGVAVRTGREVVLFVAFPKFGKFEVGFGPMRAVGKIFDKGAEGVEIGVVVALFVRAFGFIGADDVVMRVAPGFGGGVFFDDVFKDLPGFFGIFDGELVLAFFHLEARTPFGRGFVVFFELARGFVGLVDASQAVEAQHFAGRAGLGARGFGHAPVSG